MAAGASCSVSEITGMEGEVMQMQELYKFVKGVHRRAAAMIHGSFRATGIRPTFLADLKHAGHRSSRKLFRPKPSVVAP